jgi:hypothetical protein
LSQVVDVYLETGRKRIFAGAVAWPGWCRSARDESSALQILLDYGQRYEVVTRPASLGFKAPTKLTEFKVVERLQGGTTTDFGAPEAAPAGDSEALDAAGLKRYEGLLQACWQSFDAAAAAAKGKSLRTGPRGGGRDLEKMVEHALGADEAYLSRLGWSFRRDVTGDVGEQLRQVRDAILQGLRAAASGEIPALGPKGGRHWSGHYFVRRAAWHVLDHAWEIEDREG